MEDDRPFPTQKTLPIGTAYGSTLGSDGCELWVAVVIHYYQLSSMGVGERSDPVAYG